MQSLRDLFAFFSVPLFIWWCTSIVVTFALGFLFSTTLLPSLASSTQKEQISAEHRESGYVFINPLLECEYNNNQGNIKLKALKDEVEKVVSSKADQDISLYYRDLLNGPWYGYDENETFSPQSLLKLPIILAYFKIADENPNILNEEIEYKEILDSNLPVSYSLELGKRYTVDSLIQRTIQQSDNVAFTLLVDHLPLKFVEKVHDDLNIPYPKEGTPTDFISVRSYSSIFRVLYNASYLSRRNSEYLLELLSKSDFPDGLVAGVPKSVPVSHKFGIKNPSEEHPESQLHDCGVVYHPDHPYLLCIMTKANNQNEQIKTIEELSNTVYKVISSEE
ncbi:MAG: beta-lactamase class [Patescibacteria group bacterium]|nr:beta-lactamase class [Patescibacteria group bacterium]